jgi:hypothetical protein
MRNYKGRICHRTLDTYCAALLTAFAMDLQVVRLLVASGGAATVNVHESQTGFHTAATINGASSLH